MFDASVVIPTYNRSKLLALTLDSLSKQKKSVFRFEVIIVDDGSDDDTRKVVKQYKNKFNRLRYYYQKKKGFRAARARNIGIRKSRGDVIIFLDSGVLASEDFIIEHCKAHGYNKHFAVIGTVYGFEATLEDEEFFNAFNPDNLEETFLRLKNVSKFHDPRHKWHKDINYEIDDAFAPWLYFWTCNVSVKKHLLISAGMFDEKYKSWGVEDLDLGYRLSKRNVPFIISRTADAIHYPHSTIDEQNKKNKSNLQNLLYFHKKYHCIQTEMCILGRGPTIDGEVLRLWNGPKLETFDFCCLYGKNAFNEFSNKKILVVGGGSGSIVGLFNKADILEVNKDRVRDILTHYPKSKVFNMLGASTHFNDKEYDIVFVTDFFKYLSSYWLRKVIIESVRIGERVFILYGAAIDTQVLLSVNKQKTAECIKIMDADAIEHEEITIEEGNLKLSLIQARRLQ